MRRAEAAENAAPWPVTALHRDSVYIAGACDLNFREWTPMDTVPKLELGNQGA